MTVAVRNRETWVPDPVPGLSCPACRADLYAAGCGDAVLLICRCGKQVSPDELPGCVLAVKSLLGLWLDRLDSLERLSRDARSDGFSNIGAVVDRHVRNLRARVAALRDVMKRDILHGAWPASTSTSDPRGPVDGAAGWSAASEA